MRGRVRRGMGSMDYSNVGPRSSKRWDWRKVNVIKEWEMRKILESNNLVTQPLTHLKQLTRE